MALPDRCVPRAGGRRPSVAVGTLLCARSAVLGVSQPSPLRSRAGNVPTMASQQAMKQAPLSYTAGGGKAVSTCALYCRCMLHLGQALLSRTWCCPALLLVGVGLPPSPSPPAGNRQPLRELNGLSTPTARLPVPASLAQKLEGQALTPDTARRHEALVQAFGAALQRACELGPAAAEDLARQIQAFMTKWGDPARTAGTPAGGVEEEQGASAGTGIGAAGHQPLPRSTAAAAQTLI
jgi:hypothetical protein